MKRLKKCVQIILSVILLCSCSTNTQNTADTTLEKEIGAFEITAQQRELAKENEAGYEVLDAGRGNPNWVNTKVRYAYTRLMDFATSECERVMDTGDMSGNGEITGIEERFAAYMDPSNEIDAFLIDAVDYCVNDLGLDRSEVLFEFCNGIIGDYYPSPSRCLTNTEVIINDYLQSTLYNGIDLKNETDLFLTEGGSAAMSYIFHSLNHNCLLKAGDKIAIATPIFTPYLQIPNVNDYGLVDINVITNEEEDWDIADTELQKLEDTDVKAFFLVNPSNPSSHALSENTLKKIKEIVKKNPNLIILTDDVYGTFVDDFKSVYSVVPYNTILVYSFSKLYGVTGWRTGLIAVNEDNVMDKLLGELPEEDKESLREEYSIVAEDPDSMKFIERVAADSRSIGLYHTSGLSTPSQIFMDIMALSHLVSKDKDEYIEMAKDIVFERYTALMDALDLPKDIHKENTLYYTLIDLNKLIEHHYDADFAEWRKENLSDIDFLNALAKKKGVVLMYGPGFDAPEGSVRISLANLDTEDYVEIARRILELLQEYYETEYSPSK